MLDVISHRFQQLEAFREDVMVGLAESQKTLPSRWLYDDRGCELFEEITRLEEYYPTRTETAILVKHAQEIAKFCGEKDTVLLEYGAAAGIKTHAKKTQIDGKDGWVLNGSKHFISDGEWSDFFLVSSSQQFSRPGVRQGQ